jgi:hypothetical protein
MKAFAATPRLDALARLFSVLALGIALTACFAVLFLSWPEPRDRRHAPHPVLAGCCDVVITSSVDAAGEKPRALPTSARNNVASTARR